MNLLPKAHQDFIYMLEYAVSGGNSYVSVVAAISTIYALCLPMAKLFQKFQSLLEFCICFRISVEVFE